MQTDRGLDRLTFFTDAIAAIAITLLILPLVDLVPDEAKSTTPFDFLKDHLSELGGFVLSFAVIARLWMVHHTLFEHVASYSTKLRTLSLAWAFTIVLLPLPTAMVTHWSPEAIIVGFYIGTMFLSSVLLTAMVFVVRADPTLVEKSNPLSEDAILTSLLSNAEFLLALILGTVFRDINFFALLVLFLSGPVLALVRGRSKARNHA